MRKTVLMSLAAVVFTVMVCVPGIAQVPAGPGTGSIHWETRAYRFGLADPMVEMFVVIESQGRERKVFVAIETGEGGTGTTRTERLAAGTWWLGRGVEYGISLQKSGIQIRRTESSWSEAKNAPVAVTSAVTMNIPLAGADTFSIGEGKNLYAWNMYERELALESKRLNGDDVWVVQRYLYENGYPGVGEIDGWFGPATRDAVRAFQRNIGLPVTGMVDATTWSYLIDGDERPANLGD